MSRRGGSKRKPTGKARPKRSIEVRAAPDGSELCLQCGLCCDGTLFGFIKLQPDEHEYVESLGLTVDVDADGNVSGAPQPCPAFRDGCCSLYTVGRPATCGSYQCGLLKGYETGQATLGDGMAVVQLVWSLARELEQEMGLPLGTYDRQAVQKYLDEHKPWETPADYPLFLVAFYRLNVLGTKYFGYEPIHVEVQAAQAGGEVAAEEATAAP